MSGGDKRQLGKILLTQKRVSPADLVDAVDDPRATTGSYPAAPEPTGPSEATELERLSARFGVPAIDLDQVVIPLENLDLVPEAVARKHLVLAVVVDPDRIVLAMANPAASRSIEEIAFVARRSVVPYVAPERTLTEAIAEAYRLKSANEPFYVGAASPAAHAGGGRSSRAKRSRILVVDDESDIRTLLARVLSQKGYEVIEASNGAEALALVRENVPDLIVLDAMLPEIHGFDVCRRLKGSRRYGHIPILMVSAMYRGWRVAEDLRTSYGVAAFLEKPFKIGEIVAHVESALAGRGLAVSDDPSDDAQAHLERGMQAYREGDVETAIEILSQGVQIDPLAAQLHYHLGLVWARRDNVFEAIQGLERAVDLSPRHFSALKNLAVLYQRVGFKHKAIEIWERALANAPDEETRQMLKDHLMSLL